MKLHLSGQLAFYLPGRRTPVEVQLEGPARLSEVLAGLGIPAAEVYITAVNGEIVDPQEATVSPEDEVKLFPPVSGGEGPAQTCPECSASWQDGVTCQDHFHQMLFWESEDPARGIVHHLMVLCYHLQHPGLYSSDGLQYAKRLLVDFMEHGLSTQEVRRRSRDQVSSTNRTWKVTGRPGSQGDYQHPIHWKMTTADVAAGGAENYVENVRKWAELVYMDIRESGNL